jgi:hypothetical protein
VGACMSCVRRGHLAELQLVVGFAQSRKHRLSVNERVFGACFDECVVVKVCCLKACLAIHDTVATDSAGNG